MKRIRHAATIPAAIVAANKQPDVLEGLAVRAIRRRRPLSRNRTLVLVDRRERPGGAVTLTFEELALS